MSWGSLGPDYWAPGTQRLRPGRPQGAHGLSPALTSASHASLVSSPCADGLALLCHPRGTDGLICARHQRGQETLCSLGPDFQVPGGGRVWLQLGAVPLCPVICGDDCSDIVHRSCQGVGGWAGHRKASMAVAVLPVNCLMADESLDIPGSQCPLDQIQGMASAF